MLGTPLWLDGHIHDWERSSYARVCVRMTLDKKLLTGVWISSRFGRYFQRVEYEGITHLCFRCGVVGHTVLSCSSIVDGPVSAPSPETGTSAGSPSSSDPPHTLHPPRDVDMSPSSSEDPPLPDAPSGAPSPPPPSSPPLIAPAPLLGRRYLPPMRRPLRNSTLRLMVVGLWYRTLVSRKGRKPRDMGSRPLPRPLRPLLLTPSPPSSRLSGPSSAVPRMRVPFSRTPVLPFSAAGASPSTAISNFASVFDRVAQLNREPPRSTSSPTTSIGGDISSLVING